MPIFDPIPLDNDRRYADLPIEEQRGILSTLGHGALDTISWLDDNIFQKAARPVKQLGMEFLDQVGLAPDHDFQWSEMLTPIPYSDTMGLTDPKNIVHGKDIADVLVGDDPDSYWDDALGIGIEVAADPTTYLSFGTSALGAGGKALNKMGVLDDVLASAAKKSGRSLSTKASLVDNLGGLKPRQTGMQYTIDDAIGAYKQDMSQIINDPMQFAQWADNFDNQFVHTVAQGTKGGVDDLSKVLNENVHNLFSTPFTGPIGSGRLSQSIAGAGAQARDLAGRGFRATRIPDFFSARIAPRIPGKSWTGRGISPKTRWGQKAYESMVKSADKLMADNEMALSVIGQKFAELDILQGAGRTQYGIEIRKYLEAPDAISAKQTLAQSNPQMFNNLEANKIFEDLDYLKDLQSKTYQIAEEAGLPTEMLKDMHTEYFHRTFDRRFTSDNSLFDMANQAAKSTDRGTLSSNLLARKESLRDIPGGTAALMKLSIDPRFSGAAIREGGQVASSKGRYYLNPTTKERLIDELLLDPEYSQTIVKQYMPDGTGRMVAATKEYQRAQLGELLETIGTLNTKYADESIPMYKVDPIQETRDYMNSMVKAIQSTEYIYSAVGELANTAAYYEKLNVPVQSLVDLLRSPASSELGLGLARDNEITDQALRHVIGELNKAGKPINIPAGATKENIISILEGGGIPTNQIVIPQSIGEDLTRAFSAYTNPQAFSRKVHPIIRLYDASVNSFKTGLTSLFIPFHLRNHMSGVWTNYVTGILSPWGYKAASSMSRKNIIEGASEIFFDTTAFNYPPELAQFIVNGRVVVPSGADVSFLNLPAGASASDAVATQILMHEIPAYKVWTGDMHKIDLTEKLADEDPAQLFLREGRVVPGSTSPGQRTGVGQQLSGALDDAWETATASPTAKFVTAADAIGQIASFGTASALGGSPLGAILGRGGVGGRRGLNQTGKARNLNAKLNELLTAPETDISGLYKLGNTVGSEVEFMNRVSGYLTGRKKGMVPQEAASKVARAQIDYSMLTEFERMYMKRIIPFYSFTRGSLPVILENVVTNPGGAQANLLRVAAGMRDEQTQYESPRYIRQGLNVPLPEGAQQALSYLGLTKNVPGHRPYLDIPLPMQDAIQIGSSLGSTDDFFQMMMNRAAPAPKAAFRAATGLDPRTGRPLYSVGETSHGALSSIPGMGASYGRKMRDVRNPDQYLKDYWPARMLGVNINEVDSVKSRNDVFREYVNEAMKNRSEPSGFGDVPVFLPTPGHYLNEDRLLEIPGYYGSPQHLEDLRLKKAGNELRYFQGGGINKSDWR